MRGVGGVEVEIAPEGGEVLRVGAIGATGAGVDVVHQCGGGAVGAPEFGAMRAVVGPEVEIVPEGGEVVRPGAIGATGAGVDVHH